MCCSGFSQTFVFCQGREGLVSRGGAGFSLSGWREVPWSGFLQSCLLAPYSYSEGSRQNQVFSGEERVGLHPLAGPWVEPGTLWETSIHLFCVWCPVFLWSGCNISLARQMDVLGFNGLVNVKRKCFEECKMFYLCQKNKYPIVYGKPENSEEIPGFSGGSVGKNSPDDGDAGLIPGLGRSPGEGNATHIQYSCLKNSMDRGAFWATVHGIPKELDMT